MTSFPLRAVHRFPPGFPLLAVALFLAAIASCCGECLAQTLPQDWPQWGGTAERNQVAQGSNIPTEWKVGDFDRKTGAWDSGTAENILWVARLGSESYASPVVAGQHVYVATNNGAGYLKRFPPKTDLGCLLAFQRATGAFAWQLSRPKLEEGRSVDWPEQGICSTPCVEGNRLWVVSNRGEVLCLDTEGFSDGENDGTYQKEESAGAGEADIVWLVDMMAQFGSRQHNMASCSVTTAGNLLLVMTSNGVDDSHEEVPAPHAPSFIAVDKASGELIWADASPGANILHGQWSSPAVAVVGGEPQAIFAGGDGWLYSFLARPTDGGKPKLLWKFDCNPKAAEWKGEGSGDRGELVATPVVADGLVYMATGHDPEFGEAEGHLWCITPSRRGDVSSEQVVDAGGNPVPPRRTKAVDTDAGEVVRPNPNSAAVWHYAGYDANGDGKLKFDETMHRTLSSATVCDGILVIPDLAGLVHILDAKTGKPLWKYDAMASIWGTAMVVDGKIYIGDEDGEIAVLALGREENVLAENSMEDSVYGTPTVAGGILYISTRTHLFAIGEKAD